MQIQKAGKTKLAFNNSAYLLTLISFYINEPLS